MSDRRQKNQLELAFTDKSRSESPRVSVEGIESLMAKRKEESPANSLSNEMIASKNLKIYNFISSARL